MFLFSTVNIENPLLCCGRSDVADQKTILYTASAYLILQEVKLSTKLVLQTMYSRRIRNKNNNYVPRLFIFWGRRVFRICNTFLAHPAAVCCFTYSKRLRLPCCLFRNSRRLRRLRSKHAAHFLSDLFSPFSPTLRSMRPATVCGALPLGLEGNILWWRQSWLSRGSGGRWPLQSFQKRRKKKKHAVFEKWRRTLVVLSTGRDQQSNIVLSGHLHSPNETESGRTIQRI